jgi:cobyrinic acid a,c-diamide synthase
LPPAPQVLVPKGYTKQFIDGTVTRQAQVDRIQNSFAEIDRRSDITLVEGTGHVGVGSIIEMSNAQTAALIGADVVLVANGGLGSAFDELEVGGCARYPPAADP